MCHYNHNVLTFNYSRVTKTNLHWILQILGGGCGIAAALIKCIEHNFVLSGLHAKLGESSSVVYTYYPSKILIHL